MTDVVGRPFSLLLTAGNIADVVVAPKLLGRARKALYVIADKGYDSDKLRRLLRARWQTAVIPGRANRKRKVRYDKAMYRDRHLIENANGRIKDFRRVATRYDKLAQNFLSATALAIIVAYWI